ncbi:hypothetical protein DQE82_28790 [Micromonospora sp. LHW51205]|uniref:DUF4435 domain-containing protein n=1 Tax=Micromonospora sp. LHW51205 TaxID=2248752 RepID=UPI000DE8E9EB|nr:DUF4435 domain-containing protein [Micromonospora sp. LHW51205]RBQ04475.1 hypothetical protein DQE82_28790 [Micromonospora sp. LHW51205]
MNRLVHSPKGYLRQMQMSTYKVWIFVEGKTDRYFYSKLAEATATRRSRNSFIVAMADELLGSPGKGGGKSVLLSFFDQLRETGGLISRLGGKETRAVFFVDKDVADITGGRRRSPHVIYTEYYNVENYAFKYGDIADALAASLDIPLQTAAALVPDPKVWRVSRAHAWKDWAFLCLVAAMLQVRHHANYSAPSAVNGGQAGSVDAQRVLAFLTALRSACPHDSRTIDEVIDKARSLTENYYSTWRHDRIFNGKWYVHHLERDVTSMLPSVTAQGFGKHIVRHLVHRLDFSAPWARSLRTKLAGHLG